MTDNLEGYWERLNFFCRMGALDKWELHFEGCIYLYRLFYQMRQLINPRCHRKWRPDFRVWACRQCRQAGNDTESCRLVHQREDFLSDYMLEIS